MNSRAIKPSTFFAGLIGGGKGSTDASCNVKAIVNAYQDQQGPRDMALKIKAWKHFTPHAKNKLSDPVSIFSLIRHVYLPVVLCSTVLLMWHGSRYTIGQLIEWLSVIHCFCCIMSIAMGYSVFLWIESMWILWKHFNKIQWLLLEVLNVNLHFIIICQHQKLCLKRPAA